MKYKHIDADVKNFGSLIETQDRQLKILAARGRGGYHKPEKNSWEWCITQLFKLVLEIETVAMVEDCDTHKVNFIVGGGDDIAIAKAIHSILPVMVGTSGDIAVKLMTEFTEATIMFSRSKTTGE